MKKTILLINLFLLTAVVFSQNCTFSGKLQDQNGKAIPFASIYIPKTATGNIANAEGNFQLNLPCGEYQIRVQCLGYETKLMSINASSNKNNQTIILQAKSLQIREFVLNGSDEDPAYNVMRKAIVMAEYYKKQVKEYSCNIYVRNFFVVDDIPGLMKVFAEEEDIDDMKTGDISETLLEYTYKYPNTTNTKVLSARNGRGDTSKIGSQYINLSFYDLGGGGIISPLSRGAFQVYKFKLVNVYTENGKTVNKIKIIPRRKGNDLMKGYLHINDDSWNINRVNVNFKQQFVDVSYKQLYAEIKENAWMPISHDIGVKAKGLGFKGHFQYLASLSKLKLETDPLIDEKIKSIVDLPIVFEETNEEAVKPEEKAQDQAIFGTSKTGQKINKLITKEKLTKGETFKLVRLIKKQEKEQSEKVPEENSLERKSNHKTEYADSAFAKTAKEWESIREVPLSEEEELIYVGRDSLTRVQKGDTVINKKRSFFGKALFYDGKIQSKNKKSKLTIYGGLLAGVDFPHFNTVDGVVLRKKLFFYEYDFQKGRYLNVLPSIKYAFSREDVMGDVVFKSQYNAKKRAGFDLSLGKTNVDFNSEGSMPQFFNSISSLFFEENYRKIYQKKYAKLEHHIDVKNGLTLNTSLEYADRSRLRNHSDFKIINVSDRIYSSNSPFSRDLIGSTEGVRDNKAFNFFAKLSYTPKYYYRFKDEQKEMLYSKYPTFDFTYKQGIKDVFDSQSDFSFAEVAIHQSKKVGLIDQVNYHVGAGAFLSSKSVAFADYKGFNTQPFYFIGGSDNNSFRLLDFYSYSTKDYFLEGHVSVEDNVLFLKRLPLLNNTNLTEEFYVNYLYTDLKDHYYEFGYSLNKIFLLFDVETFVSFENNKYRAFGVKLKFNFLQNIDYFNN